MDGINVQYGKFDPSAKADSTPTVNENQPWANINDLRYDNIAVEKNVGTFEHNYIILDGTMEEMPDVPENFHWGWWTLKASDDRGNFASEEPYTWDMVEAEFEDWNAIEAADMTWNSLESVVPTLDISFDNPHSSNGITLYFYPFIDDYANKMRVTWYNQYGAEIASGIYENDSVIGAIGEPVAQYTRLKIEMLSTNIRNRFVKIYAIDYGKAKVFLDEDIAYCNILEEIDPISEKLSVNTMSLRVKTHNPEFSHVTGSIDNQMLTINQQMNVTYNGEPFGTFFLKTWQDAFNDGTVFDFNADDAIDILDSYPFMGDIYTNKPVRDLLQEIFDICFPTRLIDFVLDEAFQDKSVSGYIPIGTCRMALQYICFAIGAIADTSRRDYVWIYPLEQVLERVIPREKAYLGGFIESTEYFTGVDVVSHTYARGDEVKTVYDDEIEAGEHVFNFTEPLHSLSLTGGTILESSATFVKITVPETQHIKITGLNYSVAKISYPVRSNFLPGEVGRTKIYDGCTLVSQTDAKDIANRILLYLNMRKRLDIDVRLEDLECGYLTKAYTYGRPIIGTTEHLDIKLRGHRASLRLIGDVYATEDWKNEGFARLGEFGLNSDGELI